MSTISINNKEISLQDVADLLCNALEGGSNYWCTIIEHIKPPVLTYRTDSEEIFRHLDYPLSVGGGLLMGVLGEEDLGDLKQKQFRLDLDSIKTGLLCMEEKYPHHYKNISGGGGDAETGDVFLQYCLFGEVLFG